MHARLTCIYHTATGEVIGHYGDVLESPRDLSDEDLQRLVASGSAIEVDPPTNAE